MKYLWQSALCIWISTIIIDSAALAQLMAGPEKSWESYELIAKGTIRSIDFQREIQYIDSVKAQAFGCPVELEMVEPLRLPPGTNRLQILVPMYFIINGRKMPALQISNGEIATSNTLAITCHYYDNPDFLVIADVLSDEMWEVYRQQKNGGISNNSMSSELKVVSDIKIRFDAIQQRTDLREQLRNGEISENEYNLQKAALNKLIFRPASISDYNPDTAIFDLKVDPTIRERIDASQKKMFLQYKLQNGEITEEEFLRQKKPTDQIMNRPLEINFATP